MPNAVLRSAIGNAFCALTLIGCDSPSEPQSGRVSGVVSLADVWGRLLLSDGVTVTLDGTTLKATTDNAGRWAIADAPTGKRDLLLTKPGFSPMRVPAFSITSNVVIEDTTYMAQAPTHLAHIDSIRIVTFFGDSAILVHGQIDEVPPEDAVASVVILYLGPNADIGPSLDKHTYTQAILNPTLVDGSTGETIPPQRSFTGVFLLNLYRQTFPSGTELRFAARSYSATCSCYDDPATGRRVYTNNGPATPTASIVVP